eukprot:SAG22_NODE_87_length_21437_cov_14.162480_11_plen_108_part_00
MPASGGGNQTGRTSTRGHHKDRCVTVTCYYIYNWHVHGLVHNAVLLFDYLVLLLRQQEPDTILLPAFLCSADFVLPQLKKTSSHHFCNEALYGKMNLIMVNGVVRLK